jgi:hypothetical protein
MEWAKVRELSAERVSQRQIAERLGMTGAPWRGSPVRASRRATAASRPARPSIVTRR